MRMDSDSESDDHKSAHNSSNKSSSSNSESNNSSSADDDGSSNASSPASSPDKSRPGKKRLADIKEAWEENPDVYGIRRSSRDRKEPERLAPTKQDGHRDHMRRRSSSAVWGSSDSDDSDDGRHHHQQRPLQSRRPGGGGGGATSASAAAVRRRQQTRSRPSRGAPRQLSASSESEESSDDDKASRAVSRRTTSRVNYREQDEAQTDEEDLLEPEEAAALAAAAAIDDNADTIERVLNDRMGKRGATGAATTIYAVGDNGDPNSGFDPKEDEALSERQYMLKWKGWSHLHNTWESEVTLRTQNVKGIKKIDNYRKRTDEVNRWLRHANPEDIEYFNCQNELMQGLVSSYLLCDRVIAESPKPGHEYPDYLVKWQNLPYADCTWEDGNLVARRYELKIDQFVVREQSRQTPTKLNPVLRKRPKFTSIVRQPDYMSGTSGELVLRDYQLDGVNWMVHSWCRDNSVILADEMGLGKTIQTTCFMYYLFKQHSLFGPYLVVVPLSTLPAWQRELALWGPEMNVVTYLGDVLSRERIRHYEWAFPGNKRLKFNVLLTSYEILLKDKSFLGAISWAALLVDEAHRLKNGESLLYKVLIEFNTNYRLLITGTPLQNSLKELWSLLHFIMPHRFDKWENFEVDMDQGSKAYARLHRLLEPFLLRRVKKDVEKSLPAKVEQILRVGMTTQQKQFYKWILTRNYTMLKRGLKSAAPSLINLVMELKKCCNHAHLIKPPDLDEQLTSRETLQGLLKNSGKLVLLDKLLVRLRERGHRVLIFSQMVRMLDILAEYLQMRLFPFQRLDGSIKGDVRRQALDHFNAEGSQDFCFLLSTRAGGLGINLATADTVIIYDSDWNPQNDLQAQARAHRIGQKNQVNIYRLVTMQSVEEDIIERAKRKMVLDHLVIQSMDSTGRTVLKKGGSSSTTPFSKDELNAILKFGAEELFNKDDVEEEEPTCDIDLILQRAETREDEPGSAPANDLLSAFKVASFHVDEDEVTNLQEVQKPQKPQKPSSNSEDAKEWDDIIPSDMRAKIEEEARQQEVEDLYLPPRSRKTVQSQTVDDEAAVSSQRRKRRLEASSGDEESDSEAPKKRSSGTTKERVKGFTDAEVRRFFKAFRRFGCPLERLEAIATESELQEKSAADLRRLGETILSRCRECMRQHQQLNSAKEPAGADAEENGHHAKDAGGKKKRERGGASFRLSGVAIYARPVLHTLEELEPLHRALPADTKQRRDWQLDVSLRVKPVHWDVEWSVEDDARLLRGVYEYGMGAWESIKIDPSIQLEDKILLKLVDSKPQAKQLQARIEYLLKVLKKSIKSSSDKIPSSSSAAAATTASSAGGAASSTPSKRQKRSATSSSGRANKKAVSKEIIENDDLSTDEDAPTAPSQELPVSTSTETGAAAVTAAGGGKKGAKKKGAGPMHYTASHEPVEVSVTEELPEAVFLECKEKMRPVKRSLKALDSPDPNLSDAEQVNHTRHCLIQIGTHIDHCLLQLHQPDKIREWRSNLWSFVSKFTEFDSRKLYKLYKHAMKKQGGPAEPARSSPAPLKDPLAAADGHTTALATSHKEHRSGPEPKNNDKRVKKHDAKESRGSDKHGSKNSSSAQPGNDATRKSKDSKKEREEEQQPDPIRRTDGGYAGNNGHYGDKRPHADAGKDWSRKRERRGGSGGNAEDRRGAADGNGEERPRRGGGDSGWSDHRRSSSNSGQQRHNRDRSHERDYRPMDGGGGHHGHQHWGNSGGGYRQQQWHVGYNGPQQRGHPPHTSAAGSEWRRERSGGGEWRRGERSSDNYHYDRRGPPSSAPSGS